MKKACKPILGKKKRILFWILLSSFILTAIVYALNTFLIKPLIDTPTNFLEDVMVNYFNDFWAGVFMVAFANLIVLRRNRYFYHVLFYIALFLFESVMWEVVRPFFLQVFNPFNRVPHFMWGDFVAYGLGTFIMFFVVLLTTREKKHDQRAEITI